MVDSSLMSRSSSGMAGFSLANRADTLAVAVREAYFTDTRGGVLSAEAGMASAFDMITGTGPRGAAVYVIGNGGSSSVAAHVVNDCVNVGRLRAYTLHDAALFSCMANDYGYENAFARMIGIMARPGDVLVAVSSSGNSLNIRNACAVARDNGMQCFTLSGFKADNPLRGLGDLNLWIDAEDYGIVEMAHLFVLHTLADRMKALRG